MTVSHRLPMKNAAAQLIPIRWRRWRQRRRLLRAPAAAAAAAAAAMWIMSLAEGARGAGWRQRREGSWHAISEWRRRD